MTALTVRIPDDKYRRLKTLAQVRGVSVNRLVDEMATLMLTEFDAETRFLARVERGQGSIDEGLALLDKAMEDGDK